MRKAVTSLSDLKPDDKARIVFQSGEAPLARNMVDSTHRVGWKTQHFSHDTIAHMLELGACELYVEEPDEPEVWVGKFLSCAEQMDPIPQRFIGETVHVAISKHPIPLITPELREALRDLLLGIYVHNDKLRPGQLAQRIEGPVIDAAKAALGEQVHLKMHVTDMLPENAWALVQDRKIVAFSTGEGEQP